MKSEDSLNVANTGEESKIGEFVFPDEYPMIVLGNSLLFDWCKGLAKDQSRIPHPYEMLHYPWLLAGFFALFFTSLNLLPIGQLDGGHVLYGLIGTRWHRKIARGVFLAFIFYAGLGILTPYDTAETILFNIPLPFAIALYIFFLYTILTSVYKDKVTRLMVALIIFTPQFTLPMLNPDLTGYSGWLVFSFILGRVIGVYHPPVPVETPLDLKRKVIGWIALIIFVISFSPNPVYIETLTP
ncbi:MAG: site-2 protease family protein [Bacteroidota bacterium]